MVEPGEVEAAEDETAEDEHTEMTRPLRGTPSERYMVVLHVDGATRDAHAEAGRDRDRSQAPAVAGLAGGARLDDGTRVTAVTTRRLACDASVLRVARDAGGAVTRISGRTRTVPLRTRRALEIRDRGCIFPGCGSRFTDAHHIRHWADGGPTELSNLVLLCRTHHRLLHEGGFRLQVDPTRPGRPIFLSPRGIPIPEVPPRMSVNGKPLASVKPVPDGRARCLGDLPSGAPPRWEEDVPVALYLRMMESVG